MKVTQVLIHSVVAITVMSLSAASVEAQVKPKLEIRGPNGAAHFAREASYEESTSMKRPHRRFPMLINRGPNGAVHIVNPERRTSSQPRSHPLLR